MHGDPPEKDSLSIEWEIFARAQSKSRTGRIKLPAGEGLSDVQIPLPLERLWMGNYELTLRVRFRDREASRRTEFTVDESRVSMGPGFDAALDMVSIIAQDEELETLRQADPGERQAAWDRFWTNRDPTPQTDRNEYKEEFFQRVRYANEHFGVLEPGWRSDRGRIYIKYGPPDQVESYPQNIDSPPYEIWDYYRLRLRFVFVDYEGFGRYELQQPGRR
ncbi:MAG: GWxTD domain-containing protein [Candidatus Eisenbacteria bacterium]|nr:GWxTD domain-containing protein [Candidatus Eisenbacteria bacterium]